MAKPATLMDIYKGWDGYQISLVNAVSLLSPDQLRYRIASDLRSVGEIASHIAFGRIDWFSRMGAPGAVELSALAPSDGGSISQDASQIVDWLEKSWRMVESVLTQWTVDDLAKSFRHSYLGRTYDVGYQWTIWRIMAHDIHHGGQISMLLYAQGIEIPELGDNGGHIIEPPLAR